MKIILILATLNLALVSCGKKESPVAGEPHQEAIEKSLSVFDSGKVLMSAKADSRFFKELNKCAFQKNGDDCTPEKVPLLALKDEKITADFILENTLVSHKFLADNFKEFLTNANNSHLLSFFTSISGIVISDEISSSFYYTPTGMIYINASYLWKTQLEKSELKFKKDQRFSRDPRKNIYTDLDYLKNNTMIYGQLRKKERSISDISPNLKRLFFHELTHAIDVYPVLQQFGLDTSKTYFELRTERAKNNQLVSSITGHADSLDTYDYAMFVVYGELISPDSHEFSKEDFVTKFVPNNAMVFYSYITPREHLAMSVQSFMMLFTEQAESCNSAIYISTDESESERFWFQKNRILQSNILSETREAIRLMLPVEHSDVLNSLETNFKESTNPNPNRDLMELCIH